jgi:DNA polymerase III sliding clamp (beta) subunit (PCNA family)
MPFGVWLAFASQQPNQNQRKKYMKNQITLPVAELKEALPGLTKVIGKSRTLPVLQAIRINRNPEGIVTLSATDLDSHVTYTAKTTQPGSPADVLVPVDQLAKATKCSSPKEEIGFVSEGKDKVKLRYNIAGNVVEQTITTLPAGEFPPAPQVKQPGVQLDPQFGQALKQALACCSEDASRYVLRGACLDVSDKKFHYVVGTDGRSLFSANSFCFTLEKSVIIPDSKFLDWSDFLDEQPTHLSVQPGEEAQEAKDGQPAKEGKPAYVKLESPRWSFVTKEIDGTFPNWRQCVPTTNSKWTQVVLSEEAVKQLIQVIPNLPGGDSSNATIRLRVDRYLTIEGQSKDGGEWTSVPVQTVNVTGDAVSIALNRHYLLKGLRFGLNKLEIEDSLSPLVISNGGKKMVIMPVRMDDGKIQVSPAPVSASEPATESPTSTPTEQTQPPTPSEAPTEERTDMPRTARATTPEAMTTFEPVETHANNNGNGSGNGSAVKSLVDHVEQIKESLKGVIRDLNNMIDIVKLAEKERKSSEKEIEAIRSKLRQIQSVAI